MAIRDVDAGTAWLTTITTMVRTCVAAGCSNTNSDGVSLFQFPKDKVMRKKWADQVKRHRDKWEPTDHSVLCSKHFEQSCFSTDQLLAQSLGLGKFKPSLKSDAVPTLFSKRKAQEINPPAKRRRSEAYKKRERQRVSYFLEN